MHNYHFTQDWLGNDIPNLLKYLSVYKDKPVNFLEVGSYEGRSTVWFLTEILTHPDARITCVDWFKGSPEHMRQGIENHDLETRFDANIRETGADYKVKKIVGLSQSILRTLDMDTYDAVYIDGSHTAADVLEDAVLSFRLVKTGGIMMFDDYEWPEELPPEEKPKLGIDSFLSVYQGKYELLYKNGQVYIRKN